MGWQSLPQAVVIKLLVFLLYSLSCVVNIIRLVSQKLVLNKLSALQKHFITWQAHQARSAATTKTLYSSQNTIGGGFYLDPCRPTLNKSCRMLKWASTKMEYIWVKLHQDCYNSLVKDAVLWFQIRQRRPKQRLPTESVAVLIDKMKQTLDVVGAAQFALRKVDVEAFYMAPVGTRDSRDRKRHDGLG